MFTACACGIAMANAAHQARQHARYITTANHEHGVAYAIGQLLHGRWR
jgi:hydroxymethylpyrimidine pyrophosphatase-like HAD family hydrolase